MDISLTMHRQSHRVPSYFVRTVFPFAKNLKNMLPAKKAQDLPRAGGGEHHNCMVLQVHSSMYNQNLFPARIKN